jgi:cysteinyl-tRNA synthetase
MHQKFPERDWKKLRSLKDSALEEVSNRIIEKLKTLIESREGGSHKTYLRLWETIHAEDKVIAALFDDLKRSSALFKLAAWKTHGILSDDDFKDFTEDTQNRINAILEIMQSK